MQVAGGAAVAVDGGRCVDLAEDVAVGLCASRDPLQGAAAEAMHGPEAGMGGPGRCGWPRQVWSGE